MNRGELLVKRAIEDRGHAVHDANVVLRANCPNIDLIVYGQSSPKYVQVKSSTKPAGRGNVVVSGAPYTLEQLYDHAPIYNKHNSYKAHLVAIVHWQGDDRNSTSRRRMIWSACFGGPGGNYTSALSATDRDAQSLFAAN